MRPSILEVINQLSVGDFLLAHILNTFGKILAEPCLWFSNCFLMLSSICTIRSDFFPSVSKFSACPKDIFAVLRSAGIQ